MKAEPMLDLRDNRFNRRRRRSEPQLKGWRYAGLMLTYRCNAACRFCYYHCGPQASGLMSVPTAMDAWQGLVRIAGAGAKVHITGGEPFLYFDRLVEILTAANRLGLTPVDAIETNGGWAGDDTAVEDKLRRLDALGLSRLKISWDAFHEEFIDPDAVRRLRAIARQVLGPDRVLVRWEKHLDHPTGIRDADAAAQTAILQAALAEDACRLTGRAAEALACLSPQQPLSDFTGHHCRTALLGSKGVHIDPAGNVFNGQCSGMIVGNVTETPLDDIWAGFEPDRGDFWPVLFHDGPAGFIGPAADAGYRPDSGYGSKCHLCTDIRRFFFDNALYSPIIGPNDCYGTH